MMDRLPLLFCIWSGLPAAGGYAASPTGPETVLVVINENSPLSKAVGEYYARRRSVPVRNVCRLRTTDQEQISRSVYDREVAAPIAACLKTGGLADQIVYIATTMGVPLKVNGSGGAGGNRASVDSELTLLYSDLKSKTHRLAGIIPNPFFGKTDVPFTRPQFPIYLVTRLAGYDFNDIKGLIDRSLAARNRGTIVLDQKSGGDEAGNDWLRDAAIRLPANRVTFDESTLVLEGARNVIGLASWGSNDPNRKKRFLGFQWLPGAIMTEFVSTNARTFERPPDSWQFGTWKDKTSHFAGSPQSLTADYVREGVTGASGHVYEPYLAMTPRPNYLFPAYLAGRTLAESFYIAMPALSWMNVVIGDPLCRLAP
jgi:uncharacterized protein (TIGR03790 family)